MTTRLVLVGGFLGAGKTTALLRLAGGLVGDGLRVGILANDQGQELIDTALYRAAGFATRDVRGGCFCCRLDEFIAQADLLIAAEQPAFLLAEPVGSCTDLVATVLRPLCSLRPGEFALAPFTVLVDPLRARAALSPRGKATLSEKVTYIYRLQQMEAEIIAINKADLLSTDELTEITRLLAAQLPGKRIVACSALSGAGFADLAAMLTQPAPAAPPPSPAIDYDVYAAGEAELGWFDATYVLTAPDCDLDDALLSLATLLDARFATTGREIAHLKLLLRAGEHVAAVSVTGTGVRPARSRIALARSSELELVVNARVAADPQETRGAIEPCVRQWAQALAATLTQRSADALRPARPVPTWRIG